MQPWIELQNVEVRLTGRPILRNISLEIFPGQHWAIIGANGSGKSTLLKLLRGEIAPWPGLGKRIYRFNGEHKFDAVGVKESIGFVSPELQERYLQQEWRLTVTDAV